MPAPFNAPLSPYFTLSNGYIVRVTAQDPANGNVVGGVIASNVSLAVDQKTSNEVPVFTAPEPQLVPAQLA